METLVIVQNSNLGPALAALFLIAPAGSHAGELGDRSFPCLVEPHTVVDVSTAVEGVLDTVEVRKGDLVDEGDVVARLDSEVEQATVAQARARAAMREVSLARNREKYERAVKLSSQKFVSPDELDELESAVDLARLELEAERENRKLAEIEVTRAEAMLEQRVIRSPVTGVVVDRFLNPGEFAQAQPIVRLAQLDPLNVEGVLPGHLHGGVHPGMSVDVVLPEPFAGTLTAPVTIVEKVIDAASGTFGVRIEVANPDYRIPAGLECSLRFNGGD